MKALGENGMLDAKLITSWLTGNNASNRHQFLSALPGDIDSVSFALGSGKGNKMHICCLRTIGLEHDVRFRELDIAIDNVLAKKGISLGRPLCVQFDGKDRLQLPESSGPKSSDIILTALKEREETTKRWDGVYTPSGTYGNDVLAVAHMAIVAAIVEMAMLSNENRLDWLRTRDDIYLIPVHIVEAQVPSLEASVMKLRNDMSSSMLAREPDELDILTTLGRLQIAQPHTTAEDIVTEGLRLVKEGHEKGSNVERFRRLFSGRPLFRIKRLADRSYFSATSFELVRLALENALIENTPFTKGFFESPSMYLKSQSVPGTNLIAALTKMSEEAQQQTIRAIIQKWMLPMLKPVLPQATLQTYFTKRQEDAFKFRGLFDVASGATVSLKVSKDIRECACMLDTVHLQLLPVSKYDEVRGNEFLEKSWGRFRASITAEDNTFGGLSTLHKNICTALKETVPASYDHSKKLAYEVASVQIEWINEEIVAARMKYEAQGKEQANRATEKKRDALSHEVAQTVELELIQFREAEVLCAAMRDDGHGSSVRSQDEVLLQSLETARSNALSSIKKVVRIKTPDGAEGKKDWIAGCLEYVNKPEMLDEKTTHWFVVDLSSGSEFPQDEVQKWIRTGGASCMVTILPPQSCQYGKQLWQLQQSCITGLLAADNFFVVQPAYVLSQRNDVVGDEPSVAPTSSSVAAPFTLYNAVRAQKNDAGTDNGNGKRRKITPITPASSQHVMCKLWKHQTLKTVLVPVSGYQVAKDPDEKPERVPAQIVTTVDEKELKVVAWHVLGPAARAGQRGKQFWRALLHAVLTDCSGRLLHERLKIKHMFCRAGDFPLAVLDYLLEDGADPFKNPTEAAITYDGIDFSRKHAAFADHRLEVEAKKLLDSGKTIADVHLGSVSQVHTDNKERSMRPFAELWSAATRDFKYLQLNAMDATGNCSLQRPSRLEAFCETHKVDPGIVGDAYNSAFGPDPEIPMLEQATTNSPDKCAVGGIISESPSQASICSDEAPVQAQVGTVCEFRPMPGEETRVTGMANVVLSVTESSGDVRLHSSGDPFDIRAGDIVATFMGGKVVSEQPSCGFMEVTFKGATSFDR